MSSRREVRKIRHNKCVTLRLPINFIGILQLEINLKNLKSPVDRKMKIKILVEMQMKLTQNKIFQLYKKSI